MTAVLFLSLTLILVMVTLLTDDFVVPVMALRQPALSRWSVGDWGPGTSLQSFDRVAWLTNACAFGTFVDSGTTVGKNIGPQRLSQGGSAPTLCRHHLFRYEIHAVVNNG